ncbi:PAAR domain-containing protein [Massilia cavernae]|uniref:PAAR domain-containing protein n=1 Tax=Massilia cavernae TaxID=2320864 RepID=A0A418XSZ5_9BURK|nr:PAAR domain-containing protein [Massilia cavernae]RJG15729.1 PAAR domain-containing protein [Massilia cavernae]
MPKIIRQNDPTSHGGKVVQVAPTHFTVGGVAVACLGDKATCPIHGPGTIVEGEATHTIDGVPVAYEGHKTSCGATLMPTDPHLTCT